MKNHEISQTDTEFTIPASLDFQKVLTQAREYFLKVDPNIIGVNIGPRRVNNSVKPGEFALVVYVLTKKPQAKLDPAKVVPGEFMGLRTDVHAPFSPDAPKPTGDFVADRHISSDLSAIDWVRLHELGEVAELPPATRRIKWVQDFGDVCVIHNDGTLVKKHPSGEKYVDFVRAYKLFRTLHGDDYDFVTFFINSDSGMPGAFYQFMQPIFNDVQGIGAPLRNDRPGWGTSRLQGFHLMKPNVPTFREVMLQEFGHRFAAFVRYKDPVTGETMTDHLLDGYPGHWAKFPQFPGIPFPDHQFDDDRSPMDYGANDWVEMPSGEFRSVHLNSEDRAYCNLDLYLMGLLGPGEVGEFTMLRDVKSIAGSTNFSATPVRLNIQNFIDQEGPRIPNVDASPKHWRQAFIVLTNDSLKVHDFVDTVDTLRLRWERDFSEATKGLGRVDTVLDYRTGSGADFTVVVSVRQGFGNEPGYLNEIEADVPFVGAAKDFTFSCPNVEPGKEAVLMFQSRAVNSKRNIITINGRTIFGGIPVSPSEDSWNGNTMLISAGTLKPSDNILHIESRNLDGGTSGNIDDFIIDNVVVMYKTR